MFKSILRGRGQRDRKGIESGVVVTPPMTPEFWQRVLRAQFIWCEGWLVISILCAVFGAILELKGCQWSNDWSINFLGLVLRNLTPGLSLMAVGLWAAKRAEFNVIQQAPPEPPPLPPPPPEPDKEWWICRILRIIFGRKRRRGTYITWGRYGIVVPAGAADKKFWELAERYQWWISVTGMSGGFLCAVLGVLVVWLSNLANQNWFASIGGIEIKNAPVGAMLFLMGIALQEFTRYEVQAGSETRAEDKSGQDGSKGK